MSRMNVLLSVLSVAGLAACSSFDRPALDPTAAASVAVSNDNPPPQCAYLGTIRGSTWAGDMDEAKAELVGSARSRGGNWVAVDFTEKPKIMGLGGYAIYGRLFACQPAPGSSASPTTANAVAAPAAVR